MVVSTINSKIDLVSNLQGGALTFPFTMPTAFSSTWDNVNYPLGAVTGKYDIFGNLIVDCALTPESFFPSYTSRPTYWVDVAKADDTGDGLSAATAKRTISAAVTLANTGGVAARIRVKAGYYNRNRNFSTGSIFPTVNTVFEAYGGRVVVTAAEDLTYTVDANGISYTSTRTNCSRVYDVTNVDDYGRYIELTKVATAAIAKVTPGSWSEVTGALVITRADGAVVSNANTRVFIAVDNFRLQGTTQNSCLITGETSADGFDVEGGQSGAVRIAYTGGAGGTRTVFGISKGSTFRYSGHSTGAVGNIAIEGLNGLAIIDSIDASDGATDCLNFHNALGATMYAIVKNSTGYNGGRFAYVSNNGFTGHDTMSIISLGGKYFGNKGVNAHIIDNCKAWMVGVLCGRSKGDKMNGGNNFSCDFKTEDNSEMWLDSCSSEPTGGGVSLASIETSKIHTRNMSAYRNVVTDTAVIDTY